MRIRPLIAASAIVVVASLGLAGCSGTDGSADGSDATSADLTLTIGAIAAPTTFSPQESADGPAVQWFQPSYDTLIHQKPDGEFEPMIADSWEYDDTNTVLTFHLHDGVTFASGGELDASVVEANLEATRDGSGALAAQLASIEDVVVVDPQTVELHLVAPDPALMRTLSQPSGMMTKTEKIGSPDLATEPDGTGPYVLDMDKTVSGSEYVFEKRDDYWNTNLELPYDTIVMKPMTDITARVNALASGQIDATTIDNKSMETVKGSGANVITFPAAGVVGLFLFDRAGAIQPALGDVRVRQAINMALDRDGMLKSLRSGLGTVTEQVFNPQSDVWDKSLNDTYDFDPAAAKKLLAEAGFPNGFTIQIPDITAGFPEGNIIAQQLADIGITVEWVQVAQTELFGAMLSGQYPVILMQLQSTEPWQAVQFFIAPQAGWNPLHSQDPELDALIESAQLAPAGDEQTAAFQKVSQWLVENAWYAPLYFPDNIYATSKDVVATPQIMQGVPSIYNYAPAE